MRIPWAEFKAFVDARNTVITENTEGNNYLLETSDGPIIRACKLIEDSSDMSDYVANYQANANSPIEKRDADGRVTIHTTTRSHGMTTYISALDDDQTDGNRIGGGANPIMWDHKIGDTTPRYIYSDFNTINNETHIVGGFFTFEGAKNDDCKLEIVPKLTIYSAGTNTNYTLFGGYLILPASGDGDISVNDNDRVLVEVAKDLDTGKRAGAGYWDADFNTSTGLFENITPNPAGTGIFNMFGAEVTLSAFVPCQPALGSHMIDMTFPDKSYLAHGLRVRTKISTLGVDHNWSGNISLVLYRMKTI